MSNKHKTSVDGNPALQTFLPESGALVTMLGVQSAASSSNSAASATKVIIKDADNEDSVEFAKWGTNNDWPSKARQKVEKSTTAAPLLFKAVSLIYGSGVHYYFENHKDGKKIKEFKSIQEIDDFIINNKIGRFMIEQLMDYKYYGNTWSEFILNSARTKIDSVYHLEAEFTRLAMQNSSGVIPNVFYSGDWDEDDTGKSIPLLNVRESSNSDIKEKYKKNKFAYHTFYPSPGRTYYAMPPHGALYRDKGWLDFSNSVPEMMNSLLENQMVIKYHIQIPYEYWQSMFADWSTYSVDKKKNKIDEKLAELNDWLTGKENVGKAFISHFATDPITRKKIAGWEITAIEDKIKKDEWIPSTDAADIQIARAIGTDMSMSGIAPAGGKLGAGSGSDKRTGFQNSVSLSYSEQEIIFETLYLISRFNGWPSNIKWAFSHVMPTTLDENPTGNQNEL